MATVYREGQCLDQRPTSRPRVNVYFSQLDAIREQRPCPPELINTETDTRTGNYSRQSRACPCNHLAFRSYAERIRCVNKQRGPCEKCA